MTKRKAYDASGRFLRFLEDEDIIRDGEVLRVEMTALDGMDTMQRLVMQDSLPPTAPRSAPGYVVDSVYEDRSQRFFDRKQQIADAWKQTPPLAPVVNGVKPAAQTVTHDADAAYERRNAGLERAYMGGA